MLNAISMAKDFFGKQITNNQKISSTFYSLVSKRRTAELLSLVREITSLDTISDPFSLRELRSQVNNGKTWYTYDEDITNSLCYGIWRSLFPFANLEQAYQTPSVEHGFIPARIVTKETWKAARPACATFGEYRRSVIQSRIPIPVFSVGPYIQYAQPYYSEVREHELRRESGRTLLYFLSHSVNTANAMREESEIVRRLKDLAKQFDTVLVSVFWWDINNPFVDRLASEGFRIVSAGYVNDPNFLSRLKSIIRLADTAVSDSLGTHAAYCTSLGIPFKLFDCTAQYQDKLDNVIHDASSIIIESALVDALKTPDNQESIRMFNYYWGIGVQRTLDERQQICNICDDIYKMTDGHRRLVLGVAKRLIKSYLDEGLEVRARLLLDALPDETKMSDHE